MDRNTYRQNMGHRFPDPSDPIWSQTAVNPPDPPAPSDEKAERPRGTVYRGGRGRIVRFLKRLAVIGVIVAIGTPIIVWLSIQLAKLFLAGGLQ